MRVDPNFVGQTPAHSTDVRHYERDDAKRMSELMTRETTAEVSRSAPKDTLTKVEEKLNAIKDWYASIKEAETVSKQSVLSSLKDVFSDPQTQKEALWYAFHQAKCAKGTDDAVPELLSVLKQELLGDFAGQLMAEPPTDRAALKAMLAQSFPLGAQKEQALWHCWAELKSLPEMTSTVDLVREELSFVIQKNAMVKNIMTHSHKLDLS
ncbi:TPA: YopR family T3SS polymerization control protein VscH [Vibrio parahaemolyticus]|uniref:YopR family T3SS polymerization control protein VscH n=1 Tax=Vibrio parahaemolyticus TaxID=670 RepID=UPI001E567255|nr:YopR family T3SS polymerization control protein VscH [Vibrio parahaemolyticus]EKP4405783.1 YopR family T3SS polymerization control protein VscH [Vibrio parahaemolyticus]MDF4411846.1 YopR family T3SS polymerization control protein VscH [Vibrio parahaemolyticus]MDF4426588.1 YopR family T3SS polymerization control protein VscH [Vibrio parahaemolyticus]MDF4435782.1 YopR family T3SS polymerization control protein VscH [Vibrio parahaemolyticus]MDF4445479.1 YopR family T3SS polymerization control 